MGWESSDVVKIKLSPPPSRSNDSSLALVSCPYLDTNLHQFSDV